MNKDIILKAENISKQYRLGQVGTGTLSHDLNRWWHEIRGEENPYLKIGAPCPDNYREELAKHTEDQSTKAKAKAIMFVRCRILISRLERSIVRNVIEPLNRFQLAGSEFYETVK